jgi:hypothetical protein
MTEADWRFPEARFVALMLWGELTRRHGLTDTTVEDEAPVILALNAHHDDTPFVVPHVESVGTWLVAFDTALPYGTGARRALAGGEQGIVKGRSMIVMVGIAPAGASGTAFNL